MEAYAKGIVDTAMGTAGCNLVVVSKMGARDMGVVPGQMMSLNSNAGKDASVAVISEAMTLGKLVYTEVVEVLVTDVATIERNPGGEYRSFARGDRNVIVDPELGISIVYCSHNSVRPSLVPAVDAVRDSYVAQRAFFKFGGAKLYVEFQEEKPGRAPVNIVYAEINPARASTHDIRKIVRTVSLVNEIDCCIAKRERAATA